MTLASSSLQSQPIHATPRKVLSESPKGDAEMNGKVTYRQHVSFCGKPKCRKCRDGIGHGPYWYAYQVVDGHTVRTYIGKHLPSETKVIEEPPTALTPLNK